MAKKLLLITTFILLTGGSVFGQKVFQLTGLFLDKKTNQPVPYVAIKVENSSRPIYISTQAGFFSIPVLETDVLTFVRVGYKRRKFSVKKYVETLDKKKKQSPYIYAVNRLTVDAVEIEEITIYPYNSKREIITALKSMNVEHDAEIESMKENLDPKVINDMAENLGKESYELESVAQEIYTKNYLNKNLVQTGPTLNPIAMVKFIEEIISKMQAKKNKNYDYFWDE